MSYQEGSKEPDSISSRLVEENGWVEQLQKGNTAVFDQIVLRYERLIYAVALRMLGDAEDARDIAQDVFVRAYQGIRHFRRQAKLSTWLVSIAMNLCRNRRRFWARRRRLITASIDEPLAPDQEGAGYQVPDPSPNPVQVAEYRQQREILMAALQQLNESSRRVIVLRDIHSYSYEEISQILCCREGTVKSRLNRARIELRALVNGRLG
ncbi:MAG: sigma-70 family RNA polymerase sigma factor [Candidatus Omnitrophica bacterium]|nr:sigma-70 family RNA polymerase sigma factor [Candidatus Omnitrophota bacterium]MBI2174627.1 sigma-70 family RNA polymerase sigma factor [Candidatus Omnitrophota bacterium]MBI3010653.1 sigma-70 family RNA polymerase sigma factor [Candidatus Omnitrophota bacterium]